MIKVLDLLIEEHPVSAILLDQIEPGKVGEPVGEEGGGTDGELLRKVPLGVLCQDRLVILLIKHGPKY